MWNRIFEQMLDHLFKQGSLTVHLPNGREVSVGDGTKPRVIVRLRNHALLRKLLLNPELAMGEAYMDGSLTIDFDDLRGFLTLVVRNFSNGNLPRSQLIARKLRHAKRKWDQHNPLPRARRNSNHHYSIPTSFYEQFLDQDLQYTCAYFLDPTDTLEQAQDAKKQHIARKLLIDPGMRVLDIGSGWGGLALTLARDYGAHVTGVTLSREQLEFATRRAEDAGLADKITFRLQDYRNVTEKFDRIVSVGMLEHVGQPQYATYFNKIQENLTPDGIALVHFIGRTSEPGNLSPWFQKYIFPGGYAPSLSEVLCEIEKTQLEQADVEVWRSHYDRTVREWHKRFEDHLPEIRALGYDETFIRMWRYYLIAAELSLSDMPNVPFQIQLHKHQTVVPITRDYLYTQGSAQLHSAFPNESPELKAAE